MRTIKFRAWDKEEKKFVPRVFNVLLRIGEPLKNEMFEFEQFTGLCDKEGKEIYEGDIVCDGIPDAAGTGIVVWQDATAGFCVKPIKQSEFSFYAFNKGETNRTTQLQDTEVIGNIHESAEEEGEKLI